MTGATTQTDPAGYSVDTRKIYEAILGNSIARRIFPIQNILKVHQDTWKYWDIINDVKTNLTADGVEFPVNDFNVKDTDVNVPIINTAFKYGRHEIARINDSILPFNMRERIAFEKWAIDEDMYAIAGESTYNGIGGIADTTNFSTAASTELDLTSFTTLKSSLNANVSQLNNNLNASSGGAAIKQYDTVSLMTSDVEERLHEMVSTLDDKISGFDIYEQLMAKRTGGRHQIEVSNMLGATVAKDGNSFKKTVDGTTNFALFTKNPAHSGIVTSPLDKWTKETDNKGINFYAEQRLRNYSILQGSIIYSGTVDITA